MTPRQVVNLVVNKKLENYNIVTAALRDIVYWRELPSSRRTRGGREILYVSYKGKKYVNKDLRFPIGFFFIRGDRGGVGKLLAEEMTSSLEYWHKDSGRYIDFIFPGWMRSSRPKNWRGETRPHVFINVYDYLVFNIDRFINMRQSIEEQSRWRFSGETDILLVNYIVNPALAWGKEETSSFGHIAFEEAITLNVEQMIRKKLTPSIDALMHEIISARKWCQSLNCELMLDN